MKLFGGYFIGNYSEIGTNSPLINFNYRATFSRKKAEIFNVGLLSETGINIVNEFFPLYSKICPEIRLLDNFLNVEYN